MTDGSIIVDAKGDKTHKVFGPDDHDAINALVRNGLKVMLVSADRQGEPIVSLRAAHMGVPFVTARASERMSFICDAYDVDPRRTVYMGDGWHDARNMGDVAFGIAPADAWPATISAADAVTSRSGGHRAVAQAADFILRRLV
jgi:YrbI family 3-deoxy-D-manno-octulosonate 8-phosphate phosphatase